MRAIYMKQNNLRHIVRMAAPIKGRHKDHKRFFNVSPGTDASRPLNPVDVGSRVRGIAPLSGIEPAPISDQSLL